MTDFRWQDISITGKPRMLLGRRKASKRFDVNQVEIHQDLFHEIRSICKHALAELDRREPKDYFPFATATPDDYLVVDISDLPRREDKRKSGDEAFEPAAALAMIAATDEVASLSAAEVREIAPSMYAFSFKTADGYIGFIRNTSPRRRVDPGLRFLKFEDTLRRMDPPDLAIDTSIDVVVTPERVAILSLSAFNTLFGDIGIAFETVPAHLADLSKALKSNLPLTDESLAAIGRRCGRRVIDARRLSHIASARSGALAALTSAELKRLLERRGLDGAFKKGKLHLTDETVSEFLDAIEGRLFDDDVTGEQRRADSYSPRKAGSR